MSEEREFTLEEKKQMVDTIANEDAPYGDKLAAYEYLCENGEDAVDYMLSLLPSLTGESGQMIVEILANYKGRKDIYLWLVSYFYRGEDVPLFARLLGAYGDESAIDLLTAYARDYDVDYNEFMEIRNAVEELGGEFNIRKDFSDDPLFGYLKGVVETDIFNRPGDEVPGEEETCHDGCGCSGHGCGHGCGHTHVNGSHDGNCGCKECGGHDSCDCDDCSNEDD